MYIMDLSGLQNKQIFMIVCFLWKLIFLFLLRKKKTTKGKGCILISNHDKYKYRIVWKFEIGHDFVFKGKNFNVITLDNLIRQWLTEKVFQWSSIFNVNFNSWVLAIYHLDADLAFWMLDECLKNIITDYCLFKMQIPTT